MLFACSLFIYKSIYFNGRHEFPKGKQTQRHLLKVNFSAHIFFVEMANSKTMLTFINTIVGVIQFRKSAKECPHVYVWFVWEK